MPILQARGVPSQVAGATHPLFVEVSCLLARHRTGIARFVARLVEALSRQTSLRLFTTIQGEHARNMGLSSALPCGRDLVVRQGELPEADEDLDGWVRKLLCRPNTRHDATLAARSRALYTLLRPPQRHFARELCVFYDFTPSLLPWTHVDETLEHFGIFFSQTSGLCERAIAISESTRDDAGWLSAVPADAVEVGYPGPSLCVHKHASGHRVERNANAILVVSTLEPRKNGKFLFDWFLRSQAIPEDAELWWVGPKGWLFDGKWRISPARTRRRVRFLGMVPDKNLCELYRRAGLAIYPSLYEGFGFPVLDALRHGTPILCGYHSSLKEFDGPGVSFFDPCDAATVEQAYQEAVDERTMGFERLNLDQAYSWDNLARTVLRLARN